MLKTKRFIFMNPVPEWWVSLEEEALYGTGVLDRKKTGLIKKCVISAGLAEAVSWERLQKCPIRSNGTMGQRGTQNTETL